MPTQTIQKDSNPITPQSLTNASQLLTNDIYHETPQDEGERTGVGQPRKDEPWGKSPAFEKLAVSGLDMPIMSHKEAKAAGLRFFWTGNSCVHGHNSKKLTVNGGCAACQWLYAKERKRRKATEIRDKKQDEQAQKADQTLGFRKRQKALEVYAKTSSLEQAANAIDLSLAQLNVHIAKSASLASSFYALEKRLKVLEEQRPKTTVKGKFKWNEEKRDLLIRTYVDTGDIAQARDACGCTPSQYNDELEANPDFADRVDIAKPKAIQALEERAIQMALRGNDKILTLVLKAKLPEYKDKIQIDQTTTVKLSDEQLNGRIASLLQRYARTIIDITPVRPPSGFLSDESERQGSLTQESGAGRVEANTEQVLLHVPRFRTTEP